MKKDEEISVVTFEDDDNEELIEPRSRRRNKSNRVICAIITRYQCCINLIFLIALVITFSVAVSSLRHTAVLENDLQQMSSVLSSLANRSDPVYEPVMKFCGNVSIEGNLLVGGEVHAQTNYLCEELK